MPSERPPKKKVFFVKMASSFCVGFCIKYNGNMKGFYGVDISDRTTWGDLKEMIAQKGYVKKERLDFGDHLSLDDSKTLDQCGITEKTYITVKV